jgi:hypothetical protein
MREIFCTALPTRYRRWLAMELDRPTRDLLVQVLVAIRPMAHATFLSSKHFEDVTDDHEVCSGVTLGHFKNAKVAYDDLFRLLSPPKKSKPSEEEQDLLLIKGDDK